MCTKHIKTTNKLSKRYLTKKHVFEIKIKIINNKRQAAWSHTVDRIQTCKYVEKPATGVSQPIVIQTKKEWQWAATHQSTPTHKRSVNKTYQPNNCKQNRQEPTKQTLKISETTKKYMLRYNWCMCLFVCKQTKIDSTIFLTNIFIKKYFDFVNKNFTANKNII